MGQPDQSRLPISSRSFADKKQLLSSSSSPVLSLTESPVSPVLQIISADRTKGGKNLATRLDRIRRPTIHGPAFPQTTVHSNYRVTIYSVKLPRPVGLEPVGLEFTPPVRKDQ